MREVDLGTIVTVFNGCIDKQRKRNRLPEKTVRKEILAVEALFFAQPGRCLTLFAGYIGRAPRQWKTRSFEDTSQGQTLALVQEQLDVWLAKTELSAEFLEQVRNWAVQHKDYQPNQRNPWSGQIYRFLAQGLFDPVDQAIARLPRTSPVAPKPTPRTNVWAPNAVPQARTTEPPVRSRKHRGENVSQGQLF